MGRYLTVEPEGDVSACDKYVGESGHCFGNIVDSELTEMLSSSFNLPQAQATVTRQRSRMADCRHYRVCSGGCPHDIHLSERFGNHVGQCCGLSDLIDDIVAVCGS
jgi:uncharacterized protein